MLSILIDTHSEPLLSLEFASSLRRIGVIVDHWDGAAVATDVGIDAVVSGQQHFGAVSQLFGQGSGHPSIVVVAPDPTPGTTRGLLRAGADAVLNTASKNPMELALAVAGAAAGFCVLPLGQGAALAQRLAVPPRPLDESESQLLHLASSMTIEAAGRRMGLSRRQTQRRFRALCDDLGLSNHLAAAAAAARWGLAPGASATPNGPDRT